MPGSIFVDNKGKEQFFSDSEYQDAIAAGFVPKSSIDVIDPVSGEPVTLSSEEAVQFLRPASTFQGAQGVDPRVSQQAFEETEAEQAFGGLGNRVLAGAAGFGRGLTLGASDFLLSGFGAGEALQGLREVNPGTSAFGEITGAVLPAILSGGTSVGASGGLLARSLARTPAGILAARGAQVQRSIGGLKGAAAAGVFEGTLFGAGQGLSNIALANKPLTAEAMVSEIGINALFGGLAGGLGGVVGESLYKLGSKIRPTTQTDIISSSMDSIGSVAGRQFDQLAGIHDDLLKRVNILGSGSDVVKGNPVAAAVTKAARDIDEVLTVSGLRKGFEAETKQIRKLAEIVEEEAKKPMLLAAPKIKSSGAIVPDEIIDSTKAFKPNRGIQEIIDVEGHTINTVLKAPAAKNIKALKEAVDDLSQKTGIPIAFDDTVVLGKGRAAVDDVTAAGKRSAKTTGKSKPKDDFDQAFKEAQDEVRAANAKRTEGIQQPTQKLDELAQAVQKSSKEFSEMFGSKKAFKEFLEKDIDDAFKAMKILDDHQGNLKKLAEKFDDTELISKIDNMNVELNDEIARLIGQSEIKHADMAQVLALFGLTEGVVPEFEGPLDDLARLFLIHKFMGKHGALGSSKVQAAAKKSGFQKAFKDAAGVAGRQHGFNVSRDKGFIQRGAAVIGFQKIYQNLAEVVVGGSGKLADATSKTVNRVQAAMAKTVMGGGKAVRKLTPLAAPSVLNKFNPGGVAIENETPTESLQRITRTLDDMVQNPASAQAIHDNLMPIRNINMDVGDKMAGHAHRTAQFLQSKLPRDPGFLQQFGKSTWRPREEDIQRFARYIRAASDPAGIVERFADKTISREDWETLTNLFPEHATMIHKWMGDNLQEIQVKWDYGYRTQISRLTENPVESTARFNWQDQFAVSAAQEQVQPNANFDTTPPTTAQSLASGERQ